MFFSYRMRLNEPVFYFVFDEGLPKEDVNHALVIYINKEGEYYVADTDNEGDQEMGWSDIEKLQPKLKGLQNLFKHIPLSKEEREDYERFSNPMTYDKYKQLSYDEKSKYISFGHELTEDEIRVTPKPLISKYVTTTEGENLPKDIEKSLSVSDQRVLRGNRKRVFGKNYEFAYYPEDLKDGMQVEGDLELVHLNIKSLPDNLTVNGSLHLSHSIIKQLPKNLKVKKVLQLSNTGISEIPDGTEVGGSIYAERCTNLKILPNSLAEVKGFLQLGLSGVEKLPEGLKVNLGLTLDHSSIKELPDNSVVGEGLSLVNCKNISYLPRNLSVGESLNLEGSSVKKLSEDLKVGKDLYLDGTDIRDIPLTAVVGGIIYLNGYLSQKFKGRQILRGSELSTLKESQDDVYSKLLNEHLNQK